MYFNKFITHSSFLLFMFLILKFPNISLNIARFPAFVKYIYHVDLFCQMLEHC